MWCWWSTFFFFCLFFCFFFTWKRDCFVKWNYCMLKAYAEKKLLNYHMFGLFQIKIFTSPNLETQRYWDVGAWSKRHFADFIRVLSLLMQSWNMNSCKDLCVCFVVDAGCTIELQVHFGSVSIKEDPGGQKRLWFYVAHRASFSEYHFLHFI